MYLLQLGVVFVILFQIVITEKCVTPNNEVAECVSIYSCQVLIWALRRKQNVSESIEFVRKSKCVGRESDRMVCCGTTSMFSPTPMINKNVNKDTLLPNRTYCGYQHSDDYFRNETVVAINEFPWLANLLYKPDKNEAKVGCGGSLITNRYVLTTTRCLFTPSYGSPVGVRLGEYNAKTSEDCTEDSSFYECSDPPQSFDVEKMIPHPQHNILRHHIHDIGLLRLSKIVQYSAGTMFAKPGDILLTSNWGSKEYQGEKQDIKKKIYSKLITNEECDYNVHENQFCTKELENNTDLTCEGEIGSPVVFSFRNQWHQEGILSYGNQCEKGSPLVYTKVVNYLDWIKENIEP